MGQIGLPGSPRRHGWYVGPALAGLVVVAAACGSAAGTPAHPGTHAAASPAPAAPAPRPPAAAAGPSLTPVAFETSWIPNANQLPWYYALEHGYFRDVGLNVKISNGKGSGIAVQHVAVGKAAIAEADLTTMALEKARGAPVEAVYVELARTPFGILTARSAHITTYRQLAGKRVIDVSSAAGAYLLPAALEKAGMSMSDIRPLDTSPATRNSAYIAGKAVAAVVDLAANSPVIEPKRPSNAIAFGKTLDVPSQGLVVRADYLKAHPKVVRAFLTATTRALHALLTSPQAVNDASRYIAAHNTDVKAALLKASWAKYATFVTSPDQKGHPLGWMPPAMWQQTLSVLERYGRLKGSPNPAGFYTNAFIPATGS